MLRIALVSDTHGLLRPEVETFLRGCDHIIHAGDICDASLLARVAALAPVTAVRGNNDRGEWANRLRVSELLRFERVGVYVIHDLAELDIDPVVAGLHVVVSGHSHKPRVEQRGAVLYVNPGSAGPRRFKLPIAVGELHIDGDAVSGRTIEIQVGSGKGHT